MNRLTRFIPLLCLLVIGQGLARQDQVVCGTTREKWKEEIHLHRRSVRSRGLAARPQRPLGLGAESQAGPAPAGTRDAGDIVVVDDADGVVARRNDFNLDQRTVTFWAMTPSADRYRFGVGESSYDYSAASLGTRVENLADDDTRPFTLPFPFSFFGSSYQAVYVNSDGNLTFTSGDTASSARSLGRMTAGPPRVAALFRDLDPSMSSQGVRVLATADRFVVSWVAVPEYRERGVGPLQTFQIRLFPNGRIEFTYAGITNTSSAVVGISPGRLQGSTSVLSLLDGSSQEFSATIAERFGSDKEIDIVTAVQKFYEAHEDAYDYLVIFNNLDISAAEGALAYEVTVRSTTTGNGDVPTDVGREFGSAGRLKAVVNMGPLSQYPTDPNVPVFGRPLSRETTLGILGHEAGHLFLAYASVRDPHNPAARPMLGRQGAHWSFVFDSEASLLEGNRIRDNGPGILPRFITIGNTETYSPLDQYLMGFRAPEEVPPVFLVTNASVSGDRSPEIGVSFDGERRDVNVQDIIMAEGRRTPDHTVAQRRFRFAFLLVAAKGAQPSPGDLERLETLRRQFEAFYQEKTDGRAAAEASLRRSLRLSTAPAAGVLQGSSITASITVEKPVEASLTVSLRTQNGLVSTPSSVTIPAGAKQASFQITGSRAGLEELTAAADSRYETAVSRLQVAPSAAALRLIVVSGDKQAASAGVVLPEPVVLRVADINNLPYPGLRVQASASAGGVVAPATATTDETGAVSFRWTPGPGPLNELIARVEGGAAVIVSIPTVTVAPTLLPDPASGFGAITVAGTGQTTAQRPASAGEFLEIYATGLGPVHPSPRGLLETDLAPRVFIGGVAVSEITYSGLAPGFLWLYQVNARIPDRVPSGVQPLYIEIGGRRSNEVKVRVQ